MNIKMYKEKSDSYFVLSREEISSLICRKAEKIIEFVGFAL